MNASVSEALVSQVDLLSSLASLVGSDARGTDSEVLLGVLMGQSSEGRKELILEATSRNALRKGDWILIPPYQGPAVAKQVKIELGNALAYQLYNLSEDMGEQNNLVKSNPEKLKEMIATFKEIRREGYRELQQLELK